MIQYSTTHRNNNMGDITTLLGATAYLLIYTGTAPANCAASATGTLLGSLPCSNPFAGSPGGGVLTASAITSAAAMANGTAGYFRLCTSSAGTTVIAQGTCGVSGADLNFPLGATFTVGQTINVSSFTDTANGA